MLLLKHEQPSSSDILPPPLQPPAESHIGPINRWCLHRLAAILDGVPIRLVLWDGASRACASGPPVATVTVRDRPTLLDLLARGDLAFGEGYSAGRITVDGDLVEMLRSTNVALAGRWPSSPLARPARNRSLASARQNVHAHYDLGNDFYRLWLDEAMVYTCAYFAHEDDSLEDAQRAKLDHVCRKLALRPGQRVIEAGSGWGALAVHMARHYAVSVRAFNISEPQLEYARASARRAGVADRVEFVNADYRAIEGRCDAFVSVGMLEHVGLANYHALGEVIDRVLDRDHGRGLLHFIGRNRPRPFNSWTARHIFPGAHAPSLAEAVGGVCEPFNFAVLDVENLRLHYARTLHHWLTRFEARTGEVRRMFDDDFVRMWRLYLAGSQAAFLSGDLQLFQVSLARASDNAVPWTRRGLYAETSPWTAPTF